MAKPIPDNLYRHIEWRLHNRKMIAATVDAARQDVLYGRGKSSMNTPRGHSKHSDPTAAKGIMLAEIDTGTERAWLAIIDDGFAYYAGTQVCNMAKRFYGGNVKVKDVAGKLRVHTQTVNRLRDSFVYYCAIRAAERQIIDLDAWWARDAAKKQKKGREK